MRRAGCLVSGAARTAAVASCTAGGNRGQPVRGNRRIARNAELGRGLLRLDRGAGGGDGPPTLVLSLGMPRGADDRMCGADFANFAESVQAGASPGDLARTAVASLRLPVGYPLLLWLDPLAMFGGSLGLVVDPAAAGPRAAAALLAAIVLLSYILPGTWCLKLCPLGATQELAASPRLTIQRRLAAADVAQEASPGNDELIAEPLNRRSLLTTAVGAACAVAGAPLGLAMKEKTQTGERKTLRPPGAAAEWQFGQLCLRCGNCVRACPTRIITTRWHSATWSTWLGSRNRL